MKNLKTIFLTNSLRIGLYVREDTTEYFFGSVGRKKNGQIVCNSFHEWDPRQNDFESHITWHANGYEHHKFGRHQLHKKIRESPGSLQTASGVMGTGLRQGEGKFINVFPEEHIFTHRFVVPDEQLASATSEHGRMEAGTIIDVELVPKGKRSRITENPYAEILQQESFNEESEEPKHPSVVITHVRYHPSTTWHSESMQRNSAPTPCPPIQKIPY